MARYCSPMLIDDGLPLPEAFNIKDDCLSVNWVEYFKKLDILYAIDKIRDVFIAKKYTIKPNGRFAVLNVYATKMAIYLSSMTMPLIEHAPSNNDPSHTCISEYADYNLKVASALALLVRHDDVYPGCFQ